MGEIKNKIGVIKDHRDIYVDEIEWEWGIYKKISGQISSWGAK